MTWFRKWRVLVVAYAIATCFAIREVVVSRAQEPVQWPSESWSQMADVVGEVNPGEADTDWLQSMEQRAEGDEEEFVLRLEEALATDIKHNEFLLQDYTQLMMDRGADYQLVNWAANRWRENHPFSKETLRLALATGPADDAEVAFLRDMLARVPWVDGVDVQSYTEAGTERWEVRLSFHPAREIDVRGAIEAVSMLSLTEEQRAGFRVSCLTLEDCSMVPRQ